jgi:hypothetical protein
LYRRPFSGEAEALRSRARGEGGTMAVRESAAMTEEEWLQCDDPYDMVNELASRATERKLRLFGIVCCRQNEDVFPSDQRFADAINLGEQYVEEVISEEVRQAAFSAVYEAQEEFAFDELDDFLLMPAHLIHTSFTNADAQNFACLTNTYSRWGEPDWPGKQFELRTELADHFRDIFGNPFRPVAVDPAWLTSTAVGLAQAIYDDRAFDRLPILADALQDAGCENADILEHCRGEGPHVRGCWVVDLLLGKE